MKYLTTKQTAVLEGLTERRIRAKLKQNKRHYPGAVYRECECGRKAWFIPENNVKVKNGSL